MRLLLLVTLLLPLFAQKQGRVILISLDGMGYQSFTEDPAAAEMTTLREMAETGIYAPMQAAFPSLTAPGHAALFTGVYGNVNGITANDVPVSFEQRKRGFRAEQLLAPMFWIGPAKKGLKVVAHNPTQGYPCNAFNSGQNVVLYNGYQTPEVAPGKLLRAADVKWLDAAPEGFVPPAQSRQPLRYFEYAAGRIRFTGVVFAKSTRYDTIRMTAYGAKRYVDAPWKEAENAPPGHGEKARPLARYFSEALPVGDVTAVHFRLFTLSADGKDFLLIQTAAKEISICADGDHQDDKFKKKLLATAGAFVGNGGGSWYGRGELGQRFTDGLAERRFLETLELHARQTMRHARALMAEYEPRLLVDYLSTTDDMLHQWQGNPVTLAYRKWGYQIVDWRIHELQQMLQPEDHFVVASDHGMMAVTRELRVNVLLREMGYADRVAAQDHFLILKKPGNRALLEEVKAKLSAFRDEGKPVFGEWFWPSEKFGTGGPRGGELYFDLMPGYKAASGTAKRAIEKLDVPKGEHGALPTRPDLQALFIVSGPQVHSRPAMMRSVDVAPFVLRLLGY
ncbi:alkaline phosphatase family protein [Bryobacter aggregatus]|uniref:alkaline phosphatase family protein n=1 Tax=Bryobacter aggregatus TaxID=360054 RepID=UPI0004E210FE|nr:alkaline phosphatase family protein [Bryobacter aggregatus]